MCNEFLLSPASLCSVSGEIKRINSDAVSARPMEATLQCFLHGLYIESLKTDFHRVVQGDTIFPGGKSGGA
jgi:hypothetical protein